MRQMDPLRVDTIREAEGEVLEVGFGTGLNLAYYGPAVKTLSGLDPLDVANPRPTDATRHDAPFTRGVVSCCGWTRQCRANQFANAGLLQRGPAHADSSRL